MPPTVSTECLSFCLLGVSPSCRHYLKLFSINIHPSDRNQVRGCRGGSVGGNTHCTLWRIWVWFSASLMDSAQPPVTPDPEDLTSSSGPQGPHIYVHVYIHIGPPWMDAFSLKNACAWVVFNLCLQSRCRLWSQACKLIWLPTLHLKVWSTFQSKQDECELHISLFQYSRCLHGLSK